MRCNNFFASYPKKFSQVSPIDRHLQQIFQDLDDNTRSSPGFMKLKTRPQASSRSNSSSDVSQIEQMIALITSETSFNSNVGVDVFDLDFGVQVNSIEQPVKSNSVSSGNMSHCWTPSFHNPLDYSFIVFKHTQ